MPKAPHPLARPVLLALFALAVVAAIVLAERTGWLAHIADERTLRAGVERLGWAGPVAIVLLLALAVVASPIPSAPIALASGAAYGLVWGTTYTVVGAVLGASTAFLIARLALRDAVRGWTVVQGPLDWLERDRSQGWLMAAVALSRLVPFISFDAVSYAAGVTALTFPRFLLATLAGVLPVSLALAYGGEAALAAGGIDPVLAVLVLGGVTALPLLARVLWLRLRR